MNKITKIIPILLASFLISGCNNGGDISSTSTSTSSSETSASSSESSTTTSPKTTLSYSVNTLNWSFTQGTQFGGDDYSAKRAELVKYLNNDTTLISDITDSNKIQSGAYGDHSNSVAFQLGSGSDNGKMTLNFTKKLAKISVEAESYWKSFDYPTEGTISADTQCELKFASGKTPLYSLDLKTEDHGKIGTANIEIEGEGTQSLTIYTETFDESGIGVTGRVMIRNITFYYYED